MILFVHGFGSCGWGAKSLLLRRHVGVDAMLAPDLPFTPQRALAHLRGLLARYPVRALVGSSLGGFYATCLNTGNRPLPTILINPVVAPHRLLAAHRGPQRRWCDDAPFSVDDAYVTALQQLYRPRLRDIEPYLVLLQQGDEVLDYRDAADYYRAKDLVVLPHGSHRFDGLEHQLARIDAWLAAHAEA
ncbi:MAG: YqiA/YcfP family alpha/beta fold hydrolase [Gammaproteobacteria bacterium]|nr:YqiA/YcfP family alpha/beta fold hydrolase [Gammaproteobacteria bacterium]